MIKQPKLVSFLLFVQAFLACLKVAAIAAVYTDFGFSGIHIGFALTANLDELQSVYPNWFKEIHLTFRVMKSGVPLAFVLIFFIYRPWLKLILRKVKFTEREFWKNTALLMVSTLVFLCVSEGVLRIARWTPGQIIYSQWFHQVDELCLMDCFTTDSVGIFKVDTAVPDKIRERYRNRKWLKMLPEVRGFKLKDWRVLPEIGIISLQNDWEDETNSASNEFKKKLLGIQRGGLRSCFDSVIMNYQMNPFNKDGFYSIPFSSNCPDKKKILLLGDSFTWGHSSVDKAGSFSNTLLSRGHMVYNTGISGADVAQYKMVLETYFNRIQPDIVVVNFFMGNDVEYFQRKPSQGSPIMYTTNAGNLNTFQHGVQISGADSTYQTILRSLAIPEVDWISTIAAKTVVGTLVWRFMVNNSVIDFQFPKVREEPEVPYCKTELQEMKEFCLEREVPFVISVIPELVDGKLEGGAALPSLFSDLPYVEAELKPEMYNSKDGHFNEEGHLFYANYLQKVIRDTIQPE